ncbi:MAG: NAD-dependent epimerase/dehydratase family protein [bacterium]|nr:NAD-dependent epimerase/dehydratase family protein [bacterium]
MEDVKEGPKAILVTGCAGFIGSNFVNQFRERFPGTAVVGVDNFATGRRSAIDPNVTFYEGSVLDKNLLEQIFRKHKPEYVFHFAAIPRVAYSVEHPRETTENNVVGTVALLEAAKDHKAKRFIYSSSSSVYGGAAKLPTKESENAPNPKSPYAFQKYAGEPLCRIFSELYGLDTVVLRYFNVFGPGQYGDSPYASVISGWLEAIYQPDSKKHLFIEGDGEQSRDFCYIDNVVEANILAMQYPKPLGGEVFNIACGDKTSVNQVRELIEKYSGKKLELENRPSRAGDIKHSYADISKAQEWLGYDPKVKFEKGLKRTIEWQKSRVANKS